MKKREFLCNCSVTRVDLPACIDICSEVLGESAAKKIAQVSLSARTVGRRIEDIAEDVETLLLERIVKSQWFAIQWNESTDIENKAVLLVFARYLHEEDVHEDILCTLFLPKKHHSLRTIQVSKWIFHRKTGPVFVSVCARKELQPWLPVWLFGCLVWLFGLSRSHQSARPLIVSFTGKCWGAEKYHWAS